VWCSGTPHVAVEETRVAVESTRVAAEDTRVAARVAPRVAPQGIIRDNVKGSENATHRGMRAEKGGGGGNGRRRGGGVAGGGGGGGAGKISRTSPHQ